MSEFGPPEPSPELYPVDRQRMAEDLLFAVANDYPITRDIPQLTQTGLRRLHPDAIWPVFKTLVEWNDPEMGWKRDLHLEMETDNAVVDYATYVNAVPHAYRSDPERELVEQLLVSQKNFDYFECFATIRAGREEAKRKVEQWRELQAGHDPDYEVKTPSVVKAWHDLTTGLDAERQYEQRIRQEAENTAFTEVGGDTSSIWYGRRWEMHYSNRLNEDHIERFMTAEGLKLITEKIQAVEPVAMARLLWNDGLDEDTKNNLQECKMRRQAAEDELWTAHLGNYKDIHFQKYVEAVARHRTSSSFVNDGWSEVVVESRLDGAVELLIGDLGSLPRLTRETLGEDPHHSLRRYALQVANVFMRSDIIPYKAV